MSYDLDRGQPLGSRYIANGGGAGLAPFCNDGQSNVLGVDTVRVRVDKDTQTSISPIVLYGTTAPADDHYPNAPLGSRCLVWTLDANGNATAYSEYVKIGDTRWEQTVGA